MRRRFDPIELSLTTFTAPICPMLRTCVPPQNSSDGPARSTRTFSPYLSPKKAIAPICSASAFVTSGFSVFAAVSTAAFTRFSISTICAGLTDS